MREKFYVFYVFKYFIKYFCCVGPLLGTTDFGILVELRLGSHRSPKNAPLL